MQSYGLWVLLDDIRVREMRFQGLILQHGRTFVEPTSTKQRWALGDSKAALTPVAFWTSPCKFFSSQWLFIWCCLKPLLHFKRGQMAERRSFTESPLHFSMQWGKDYYPVASIASQLRPHQRCAQLIDCETSVKKSTQARTVVARSVLLHSWPWHPYSQLVL